MSSKAVGQPVTMQVSVASSSTEAPCLSGEEPKIGPKVKTAAVSVMNNKSQFCCVLCKQRHLSMRSMRAHLIKFHYTDYKTVVCGCCNEKFGTDAEAQKHNASEHPDTRFTRKVALDPSVEKRLSTVMMESVVENAPSQERPKVLPQSESTAPQVEPSVHAVDELAAKEQFQNSVMCQCCESAFNCISDFRNHFAKQHPKDGLMRWVDLPSKGVYAMNGKIVKHGSDSSSSMFRYLCAYCSWRFTKRKELVSHKEKRHPDKKYLWVLELERSEPRDHLSADKSLNTVTESLDNDSEPSCKDPKLDRVCVVLKDIFSPEGIKDLKVLLSSNGVTSFHLGNANFAELNERLLQYKHVS